MKESAPFWSMRGRTAYKHADSIPGPGSYSPTGSMMTSSPKYRVGTSQRVSLSCENQNPGPGTYSPRKGADSPSWTLYFLHSLGRISGEVRSFDNSGPGAYRAVLSQDSPRYPVGKGLRNSLDLNCAPGPGSYNPDPLSFRGNNVCNLGLGSEKLKDI